MIVQQIKNNSYIDLTKLDVSAQNAGYQIVDVLTGNFYVLMPSTATIDHVNVESVMGQAVMRWLKTGQNTSGGIGGSIVPVFPLTGVGTTANPLVLNAALNPNAQYVSPSGNDAHDGLSWNTAKRSLLAAGQVLALVNGGTIYYCDGAIGPLWMRGDGLAGTAGSSWTTSSGLLASTWLPEMPLHLCGIGGAQSTQFGGNAAQIDCGNPFVQTRINAMVWVVACGRVPITIENTTPINNFHNAPYRIGMDFRRDWSTGNILNANITSWARVTSGTVSQDNPGLSTLTLALPPGISIVSASRVGHVVQIVYNNIAGGDVVSQNLWIQVTSLDSNFPSGSYEISLVTPLSGQTMIQYSDATSVTATGGAIGTWATHGVGIFDFIEVASTSSEVPSGPYLCQSITDSTHIVVRDYYGYGTRTPTITVSNPGTYVLQDRSSSSACGLIDLINVNGDVDTNRSVDRFDCGPGIDFGGATDGRNRILFGSIGGMDYDLCKDPNRASWLLASGGNHWVAGLEVKDCRPNASGIIFYPGSTFSSSIDVRDVLGDCNVGIGVAAPTLDVVSFELSPCNVFVDNIGTADAPAGTPVVRFNLPVEYFKASRCGAIDYFPGRNNDIDANVGEDGWSETTVSSIKRNNTGTWADGRSTVKVPTAYRSLGLLSSARYPNLVPASGSWSFVDASVTATGLPDPFGGTGAVQVTGTFVSQAYVVFKQANLGWTVGDRFAWGLWYKNSAGVSSGNSGQVGALDTVPSTSNIPFNAQLLNPFTGDGEWNYFTGGATVEVVDNSLASQRFWCYVTPSVVEFFQPTLIHIPAADMTDNEFAEFLLTLRSQPTYLPVGTTGTAIGTKLIAHGGMGIDTSVPKVAGVSSGQLTVGAIITYEPRYAADGVTVIGWSPLYAATINP